MPDLVIGGLSRLSLCDWPGELVATLFCQGCPWRCSYCHNPELLPAMGAAGRIAWSGIETFLKSRRGLLDGVVFSGGEPTWQEALPDAVVRVSDLGFKVGLHTNGAFPERLAGLLPFLSWVGFDVKAPFEDYEKVTRVPGSGERVLASLRLLLRSGVGYQIRTTVDPAVLNEADIDKIRTDLTALGADAPLLQAVRPVRSGL